MKQILTITELERTRELCISNPEKACALAQAIVDTCGIVSCATFAQVKRKSSRTVQYQAGRLTGIIIEERKFIAINQ